MKYETLGTYRCGAYLQMTINTTTATLTVDWSWGNVNALLGSLLIVVLFVFCLLSRLLASKEEDEVDEEQSSRTDGEESVKDVEA
jgi:TRAP-type C4-dicarboxylate transport system permease small subunit